MCQHAWVTNRMQEASRPSRRKIVRTDIFSSSCKHQNHSLNVVNPLRRRKGLILCSIQYCPYKQDALRGHLVRYGLVDGKAQVELQLNCYLQVVQHQLRRYGFDEPVIQVREYWDSQPSCVTAG